MVTAGKYSVWFKTPIGEGAGVVEFSSDGGLSGGDLTFIYSGQWKPGAERLHATLCAKRIVTGPPGVFGMDELDLTVVGHSTDGVSVACTGFAKQSPGIPLELTLVRMGDD